MKRQVPRREPGVLPFVGHRDDVRIVQVPPLPIPSVLALARWFRLPRIPIEPLVDVEVVELLAPEQAGIRLPLHATHILVFQRAMDHVIKLVGFLFPARKCRVERLEGCGRASARKQQPHDHFAAGWHDPVPNRANLGAGLLGIHRVGVAIDDQCIQAILVVPTRRCRAEQARRVRFVVAEREPVGSVALQHEVTEHWMRECH